MSEIRIEQYAGGGLDNRGIMQMPQLPMLAQAITLASSAASAASATLNPKTRVLFIRATGGNVAFRTGDSTGGDPTAVITDVALNDGETRYFALDPSAAVNGALKIAVIDR
ncbi:MAG: hypothetical protein ACOYLS_01350 [Polymorphobacter sp.]